MVQERPVPVGRRLAAIVAADVAGYSRLMHNDEEATQPSCRRSSQQCHACDANTAVAS